MPPVINTFIFDLSEVLISGLCGIETALAPRLGIPPAEILPALGGESLAQLCRGEISENNFLESAITNSRWNISAEELKKFIHINFHRKIADMENLLKHLAAQYNLVLLSDHAREWVQHIHEIHPQLKIFQTRIYSFELRQTKQEGATFQRLLELIKRRPGECIFVDDNIGNVERARDAGIRSFHFINAEKLQNDLQDALLYHASTS